MIDFKTFPTTRYQGSKRKILPWIYESLKDIRFHKVIDACGGTGSVSYLLKRMGKTVTYNDKLHFNYLAGQAIIENSKYVLTDDDIKNTLQVQPEIQYSDFIHKTFKGFYYLDNENAWLDNTVTNIFNMNHYKPEVLKYKKALAYYGLFQSSIIKRPFNLFHRKNLDIRTADVKRNFGNKTTWEKPFQEYYWRFIKEANSLVFDNGQQCHATNLSILNIDPEPYDLIYIDPPYIRKEGSNESSDYFRCYHFLEGLSRYSEWQNLIDFSSNNLRLKRADEQNEFSKEKIYETIEQVLLKFKKKKIVFSYKKGGLPSIDFIVRCLKGHGKKVHTKSIHYTYALNHQNGNAAKNKEVLIIGL